MRKILVFGNALFKADSLALKVADSLRGMPGFEFVECDAAEDLERFGPDLLILDAAVGIKKVVLLDNLDQLENSPSYSMHDLDLALSLKLLMKLGKLRSVRIIALPMGMPITSVVDKVKELLGSVK